MLIGHLTALFTIIVWGITFISTKILLICFTPQEILFIRFFLGFLALCIFQPALPCWHGNHNELNFALAGLFGVTLYFLLENIALQYSLAANVGVIVSTAPFFTVLVDWLCFKGARPQAQFYFGFICAMNGIALISFNDASFSLNPVGDMLALLAAVAWAFYSSLTRKLSALHLGSLRTTRHIFFYGLLFMLPVLALTHCRFSLSTFLSPINLSNLLFLGLIASALCFATWTFCLNRLGVERASAYIYLVPVITVLCAAIVLHEKITASMAIGMVMVLIGLLISESRWRIKKPLPQSQTNSRGHTQTS